MNNWVEPGWNSKKTNYILSQGYKKYTEPFVGSSDSTTLIQTDANRLFDAYCGSEGTLNPAKSQEGYTELSLIYNSTEGTVEIKHQSVSNHIKNAYETATNVNLDINKSDSEGGRKTSFNKCFGVVVGAEPASSSYSGTVGSSLNAAPGITPQNISLPLLQYFFEQAGCTKTLKETDVWWWRGRANIQDIKNDMNAYGSLTANCSGDTRQHEFCKPGKCPSNKVIFYSQCNYGGRATELAEGEYPFNKLLATGYQNDTLQSVKVPQGMAVTMWEHDINGGREVTLDSDTPCLSSIGYMNTVSSCRIFKKCTNPTQISNTVRRASGDPTYITLTGPSCLNKGQSFSVSAGGDWQQGSYGSPWRLNGNLNNGCKNPGCGFTAPTNTGTATVTYNIRGLEGRLNIPVI